jgi:hypothetical protein
MTKKGVPQTTPTACTLPVKPTYMMKNVAPHTSTTACTWPVKTIYMIKNLVQRLPLEPVHDL